jgi:hypothetical protein
MGANVLEIKDRVQRYLASATQVGLTEDGAMTFRHGSARFFIRVAEHAGSVMIAVFCPLVFKIPPSPDVYKYVALHSDDYIFGHLSAFDTDEGVRIDLTHTLLGDYLDEEELHWAVGAMANAADDLDDKLVAQFGGHVFHQE